MKRKKWYMFVMKCDIMNSYYTLLTLGVDLFAAATCDGGTGCTIAGFLRICGEETAGEAEGE
jgi:hypothetical protein